MTSMSASPFSPRIGCATGQVGIGCGFKASSRPDPGGWVIHTITVCHVDFQAPAKLGNVKFSHQCMAEKAENGRSNHKNENKRHVESSGHDVTRVFAIEGASLTEFESLADDVMKNGRLGDIHQAM
jgi:hypothetical protein